MPNLVFDFIIYVPSGTHFRVTCIIIIILLFSTTVAIILTFAYTASAPTDIANIITTFIIINDTVPNKSRNISSNNSNSIISSNRSTVTTTTHLANGNTNTTT